jgi:hypothetical protein
LPHLEFLKLSLAVRPMYGMVPDSTIFKGVYDLMWAPIIHDEDRVAFETGYSFLYPPFVVILFLRQDSPLYPQGFQRNW